MHQKGVQSKHAIKFVAASAACQDKPACAVFQGASEEYLACTRLLDKPLTVGIQVGVHLLNGAKVVQGDEVKHGFLR